MWCDVAIKQKDLWLSNQSVNAPASASHDGWRQSHSYSGSSELNPDCYKSVINVDHEISLATNNPRQRMHSSTPTHPYDPITESILWVSKRGYLIVVY